MNLNNDSTVNNTITNVRHAITQCVESEAEVYQTILDAAKAAYEAMFEMNCISELGFRALERCVEYGHEAVEGELCRYSFLEALEKNVEDSMDGNDATS